MPTAATVASHSDACPTCGSRMAPDQRYCLACGNRRGDPRLPFMDAVVFMDSVKQPRAAAGAAPPSSPPPARRLSPSATLVAGVATLVLAIGVGVLIGRSGEDSGSGNAAAQTPQVIKVEGGGGPASGSETAEAGAKSAKGKQSSAKSSKKKGGEKEAVETGSSGTSKAAEEVLKPGGDVKLPPPTQEVGGSCEKGTAGCSDSGEFNGNFFGE